MWANGKYDIEASITILLVKKIPQASPIFVFAISSVTFKNLVVRL